MVDLETMQKICGRFADLFLYPTAKLPGHVAECLALASPRSREASARLARFQVFVDQTQAGRLEEIYTGTFDLQVLCYPYVGYQLFGESYKRGAFLVGLRKQYRAHGYIEDNELPDHLAVVLSFLAAVDDPDLSRQMAIECLIPSLEKMCAALEGKDSPYGDVISALLFLLTEAYPEAKDNATSED